MDALSNGRRNNTEGYYNHITKLLCLSYVYAVVIIHDTLRFDV